MATKTNSTTSLRYIKPLGPRILVRVLKMEERSSAGLYLPQGVKELHDEALYGEVIEVARADGHTGSLGENVSGVPLGAKILFPKADGLPVPWDPDLRLLEVKSVWATVEEVEENEIQ